MDIFSFQSLFQSGAAEGRQVYPAETVFRGQHKSLGQIIAGHHFALLLRRFQKFPGPFGGGGVVQIKNANDAFVPDSHIVADGQIHNYTPTTIL